MDGYDYSSVEVTLAGTRVEGGAGARVTITEGPQPHPWQRLDAIRAEVEARGHAVLSDGSVARRARDWGPWHPGANRAQRRAAWRAQR